MEELARRRGVLARRAFDLQTELLQLGRLVRTRTGRTLRRIALRRELTGVLRELERMER